MHDHCQDHEEVGSRVVPNERFLTEMGEYNAKLVNAGVMLAGEWLQPSSKGAHVCTSENRLRPESI